MALQKWIKDQFKDIVKDPLANDVIRGWGSPIDLYDVIEDELYDGLHDRFPKSFIYKKFNNFEDRDIFKPVSRRAKFIVNKGKVRTDSDGYVLSSVPEGATHIDYGYWLEVRALTDDEWEQQEKIRLNAIQKEVSHLIKYYQKQIKELRAEDEKKAKQKVVVNEVPKLKTIEVSMTEEQHRKFMELFDED